MSNMKGFKVCGSRGGQPFLTAVRADIKEGKPICPLNSQVPCDAKGKKQVICVEKGQEASCPITDIKIVTKKDLAQRFIKKGYFLAEG